MSLRGVFFDLYGTLLCYGDMQAAWTDWMHAFHESLVPHGLRISPAEFALQCDGFFTQPEPERRDEAFTIFEARVEALCAELGIEVPAALIPGIANAAASAWHRHLHADPECHAVLGELRKRYKLALISNFDHPPYAERLLSDLKLTDYFTTIVISGAVGVKKPDPRIFHIALEKTGLEPNEVVYVGDTNEDMLGAHAAGIQPILIARDSRPAQSAALDFHASDGASRAASAEAECATCTLSVDSLAGLLGLISRRL
jgi:putative hydrolase of the HAD superfamily